MKVCCVGRDGSRCANTKGFSFPIWTGKIYETHRCRDGRYVWRLKATFGGTRADRYPSSKFINYLKDIAEYPWFSVYHNQPVTVRTDIG